jgi:hypothetical protein
MENIKNVLNKLNNDHAACVSVLVTKILFLNLIYTRYRKPTKVTVADHNETDLSHVPVFGRNIYSNDPKRNKVKLNRQIL